MNQSKIEMVEKKQLLIFLSVAFVLPYLMGILMGYAYNRGIDVSFFPNAQMYYPAAGIMLAILVVKKEDELVPRRFYFFFITITAVICLMTIASVFVANPGFIAFLNLVIIIGSVASWLILFAEKKEKRESYGLRAHNGKASALMVILFLGLYLGRVFLSYLAGGQMDEFAQIFQNPRFYSMIFILPVNFFLVFTAFFGEEYGWRYYFAPFLQKHFGKVRGVLLLGVLWGLWHLPINIFYYSPETWLQSILSQQITCIGIGIFFSYTYLKTNNIWVPVILHFLNNNLIAVLNSGNAAVIHNQLIGWKDVLLLLIFNMVLFVPFIFTKEFRGREKKDNSL
ncbi:CPBP family intramembrane glutamic endopeptidase [Clostridium transplantifaecale]|uniref:CPBP family intramembrane glutamic endopeptidase n=1 Tax=Clostridium transplantifaecale TaxID=2479838 RepID=UPI000F63D6D0|nr:CPBP family intramembrane glutamic endopeptidase [Clostridium transplantifaecale]